MLAMTGTCCFVAEAAGAFGASGARACALATGVPFADGCNPAVTGTTDVATFCFAAVATANVDAGCLAAVAAAATGR